MIEKNIPCKCKQKKAQGGYINITDFRAKNIARYKRGHFITIRNQFI